MVLFTLMAGPDASKNGEIDFNAFPYLNIRKVLGSGEGKIDEALLTNASVKINVVFTGDDAKLFLLNEKDYQAAAAAVLQKYRKRWVGKVRFNFEDPSEHILASEVKLVDEDGGQKTPNVGKGES